jgi:hypothetical protein
MSSSKTYIICWDGALDNCKNIDSQFSNSDLDHVFYNVSSYEHESPNWIRSDDVRYYIHFYNALEDFLSTDKEVLIFNAGDVGYDSYVSYTKKIENLFSLDPDVYVFAPSFDNDDFSEKGSLIQESAIHDGLYLATHTNGIMVALRRELVQLMYDFYIWCNSSNAFDFRKMYSGWGLDTVYNSLAIYLNKKVYRDHLAMHHPLSSSYDGGVAHVEMSNVVRESLNFAESIGLDRIAMSNIQKAIVDKVVMREPISIKNVYLRMESEFTA